MADTQRSIADILTLLADNTTGLISEQDLRDAVVSLSPGFGSISMTAQPNTTATTIAGTVAYYIVAGTTALAASVDGFDQPADGQLRYTGAPMRHLHIAASISYKSASGNQDVIFQLMHYDASAASAVELTTSRVADRISTVTESTALHADVMVDNGDYIYLVVRNTSSANNVTVEYMYLFAMSMPV
jgi:hypothetical protein